VGIASHNVDSPAIALAALAVTALLVYRLKLELAIAHNEDEAKLETKLHQIQRINRWMLLPMMLGCLGFMRKAATS
jgi:uncharacterized membrane protein